MSGQGTFPPCEGGRDLRAQDARPNGAASTAATASRAETRARASGGPDSSPSATTSLRLLESATAEDGTIQPFDGGDLDLHHAGLSLFARVDILLTNFHLPRSTLFMLVVSVLRVGYDETGLCPWRFAQGYRFLFVWRMRACCFAGHALKPSSLFRTTAPVVVDALARWLSYCRDDAVEPHDCAGPRSPRF